MCPLAGSLGVECAGRHAVSRPPPPPLLSLPSRLTHPPIHIHTHSTQATDYADPYFRARWGRKGYGGFELVHHQGACMCGRFGFRLLAPADIKALDCPGRVRYPHVFVPAGAFQPLADLRLLTLYSARAALAAHVVVHAFCTACGVPVFRASDGAIDTLVVNIECLRGDKIRTLEVTYYEDLLGFPRDGSEEAEHPHAQAAAAATAAAGSSPTYGKSGAFPSKAAAAEPPRPPSGGAMVRAAAGHSSSSGSGLQRWGGLVTDLVDTVLPVRSVFGHRTAYSNSYGQAPGSSSLIRSTGATSLLSHLLSRASLHTRSPRPAGALAIDTCGHRESEDGSSSEESSPVLPTSLATSDNMWHAWDESCEVRRERGNARWGGMDGAAPAWSSSGSRGPTPGKMTVSAAAGSASGITPSGRYYRAGAAVQQGNGWERMSEGCTPPSMHQLRYHLKRHLKRRLSWLHNTNSSGHGGGEDTAFPVDHYFYHYPQSDDEEEEAQQGRSQPQYQSPAAASATPAAAGGASPAPSTTSSSAVSPAPSTPLAETTSRHANESQEKKLGSGSGSGRKPQVLQREGGENMVPIEKGGKAD